MTRSLCVPSAQITWLADAIKGVIRHGRDALVEWFTTHAHMGLNERRLWLRRIRRLETRGALHPELLPYLWPGEAESSSGEYWAWAKKNQPAERRLWNWDGAHVVAGANARAHIMSVLEAFDLIVSLPRGAGGFAGVEDEILVPSLR